MDNITTISVTAAPGSGGQPAGSGSSSKCTFVNLDISQEAEVLFEGTWYRLVAGIADTYLGSISSFSLRRARPGTVGIQVQVQATPLQATGNSVSAADILDASEAGRSVLVAATASGQRSAMGLGTAAIQDTDEFATAAQGTDAREWSALTVTPEEVDEGVSVARRAWTPALVRRAVLAHAPEGAGGSGSGSVTVTGLVVGDPSAASANSAVLQALADSFADGEVSRLKIIFPDGEPYFNQVINWRCYPRQGVNSNSQVEAVWPEFTSAGTTTFRWTGGHINGATWVFQHSATGFESYGLEMNKLRFAGPGLSIASTSAAAAIGNNATSIQVSDGSIFVAGDAIEISVNPLDGGSVLPTSMPFWATVQSVAGNVVNFLPATPSANFVVSIGNRVVRWKQTRAIEVGGQSAARQDVFLGVNFNRCVFIDFFAGVATNDTTGITFDRHCRWAFCKFGVELGYNNDSMRMRFPFMQCQRQSQVGTVTTGLRTVTGLATSQFKVGMALLDNTAPATAQAFPEWARIESIDSPTQVTMTHFSTLTGARTLQPVLGWLVAMGSGHSPWYPRAAAPYDGSRANADQTVLEHPLLSMGDGFVITDGASSTNVDLQNVYSELSNRAYFAGNQLGTSNYGPFKMTGQIKIAASMGCPVEICGPGQNIDISQTFNDPGLQFPFVLMRGTSSRHCIKWSQNDLQTSSVEGLIRPDTYFWRGITPLPADNCIIDIRGVQPSGLVVPVVLAGGTLNTETAGLDGLTATLSASTTLADAPNWPPVAGRKFRVVVNATAAATLTLGSTFRRKDRVTQIGALVAAAGSVCVLEFIGTGSLWVLLGGTEAAGAPAFV